jgi:phenylalanyl-tRNA synthetase beta chain
VAGVEHPGRTAEVLVASPDGSWLPVGVVTELDPRVVEAFEARATRVAYAELRLAPILAAAPMRRRAVDIPRLPATERDVAVVVPAETPAGDVSDLIRGAAGGSLARLTLFDLYRGAPLLDDEKSLAFRLELAVEDPADADGVVSALVAALTARGWHLRT